MVVILLLPPYTNNGCDGWSQHESSNSNSNSNCSTTTSTPTAPTEAEAEAAAAATTATTTTTTTKGNNNNNNDNNESDNNNNNKNKSNTKQYSKRFSNSRRRESDNINGSGSGCTSNSNSSSRNSYTSTESTGDTAIQQTLSPAAATATAVSTTTTAKYYRKPNDIDDDYENDVNAYRPDYNNNNDLIINTSQKSKEKITLPAYISATSSPVSSLATSTAAFYGTSHKQKNAEKAAILPSAWPTQIPPNTFPPQHMRDNSINYVAHDITEEYYLVPDDDDDGDDGDITNNTHTKFYPTIIPKPLRSSRALPTLETIPEYPTIAATTGAATTTLQKCTLCHDIATKANTNGHTIKCTSKSKSKSQRKCERNDCYSTSKTKATNSSSSLSHSHSRRHSHSNCHCHSHSHNRGHSRNRSDSDIDIGSGSGTATNSSNIRAHQSTAFLNTNYTTNTTNYVRHVTRVNFYDIDTSQVEYDSKDDDDDDVDDGNNDNDDKKNIRDADNNCDGKNANLKANAATGKTVKTVKDNDLNTIAITKEEEWITKRKTELTTTRQIETHIKRQILFEDGKVIDDSGPIVSTNTTEDTDKQETETTEKRDLGLPTTNAVTTTKPTKATAGATASVAATATVTATATATATSYHNDEQLKSTININNNLNGIARTKNVNNNDNAGNGQHIDDYDDDGHGNGNGNGNGNVNNGVLVKKQLVRKPADGLVKETNEKRVITHEEIDDYLETEDVQHYGDFSDKAYVKAIHSGVENVEEVLLSPAVQQELETSIGKRIIETNTKSYKTIDSEEIQKRSLLQDDGKIITEQKKTTEHQVIVDKELSDKDIKSSLGSQDNLLITKEANQRYFKQRDEQHMDLIEGGKVIGTEMRYAAETVQMENDHLLEKPDDWDSLSNRMRRMRRPYNKASVHHQKTGLLLDRKDALTKRPLDFDREEETRKGETIKWLESHFGSESTASNDSRDDEIDLVEPTKRSFFNVTIKSNQNQTTPSTATANYGSYDRRHPLDIHESSHNEPIQSSPPLAMRNNAKYYPPTGDSRTNHFSSKAFHDDLCATVERTQIRKMQQSSSDNYMKRDDIMQKPRHSISSQFIAKNRQNSKDNIDQLDEPSALVNGSRTDLHYGILLKDRDKHSTLINTHNVRDEKESPIIPRKNPQRTYEHFSSLKRESGVQRQHQQQHQQPAVLQSAQEVQTLDRPTAPQRRRSNDKKLRQQKSVSPTPKRPLPHNSEFFCEPPPDYSPPPPHSRSSSPCTDIRPGIITSQRYTQTLKPSENYTNFTKKKPYQHTRFARDVTPSPPPMPQSQSQQQAIITSRPTMMSSQTTQTTPSSISAASTTPVITPHKANRVGQVIGNSLRKLVNKFRSASVERKLKKSKNKLSRDSYPSSDYGHSREHHSTHYKRDQLNHNEANSTTTYQQYNVIDSHIGVNGHHLENDFEKDFSRPTTNITTEIGVPAAAIAASAACKHAGYNSQQSIKRTPERNSQYRNSAIDHSSNDETQIPVPKKNPKQRYYLGEDPYSSNLCGKENFHEIDGNRLKQELRQNGYSKNYEQSSSSNSYSYRNPTAQTLGRYQKNNRRISDSTPNLNNNHNNYRHTQTLPHKLTEKPTIHQYEIQKATITRVDNTLNNSSHRKSRAPPPPPITAAAAATTTTTTPPPPPQTSTTTRTTVGIINSRNNETSYHANYNHMPGPLKPARSYPKSLNRSKSFSIHAINGVSGMNGVNGVNGNGASTTTYGDKTNNNHAAYTNGNATQAYSKQQQTNTHLYNTWFKESPKTTLRSPSIVNLISRSQKDLTKLNTSEDCSDISQEYTNGRHISGHAITMGKQLQQKQLDERRKQNVYTSITPTTNNSSKYNNNNNNSNNCSNRNGRYQLQPKRSFDSQSSLEINKDTASIIRREEYLREMLNGGGNNSTIIKVRNMDYRK